jgi:hypothetical protein
MDPYAHGARETDRCTRRRKKIKMHFGYTELFVTASEEGTNRKAEAKFNGTPTYTTTHRTKNVNGRSN